METTNWSKQTPDKPLFPDLLWSRPENKAQAGKLLIIGGSLQGFSSVGAAFATAETAGAGSTRALLPDKLHKTLSKLLPEALFVPSTPSGSFSRQALGETLENAGWADGVLLAGDLGKNSETQIMLESFLTGYSGPLVVAGDSVDYFITSDKALIRPKTAILADFGQLQALAKHNRPNPPLTNSMGLYELVKALAQWSEGIKAGLITHHQGSIVIAGGGEVSTTPVRSISFPKLSAFMSVWLLQNPQKMFEAASSAAYDYTSKK